ncbi:hypothetical protein G646_gp023 [Serratia phage phiMAM1]|uniref:Uncharacterized protein n=1 Tax=Serratia phage phiMAM1 TaxID=1262513 RepID=K7YIP3_9CAUD|nr:hypothetical protein G646_gp023 [Serratia phage phiMAM1]AFX93491.1 hypothetical protein MAM_023 [Serratia phage phiMAM1]
MRNVEHWVRAAQRHEKLRVYRCTGNVNTINQFLAPYYIVRDGELKIRTTLGGEMTKAMLDAPAHRRFGLVQQAHSLNDHGIGIEKGDILILNYHDNTLFAAICGSVDNYREILFGLGYNYLAPESRSSTDTASTVASHHSENAEKESAIFAEWWEKNGQDYTDGTLKVTVKVPESTLYFGTMGNRDELAERLKFINKEYNCPEPERVEVKFDPEAIGQLAPENDPVFEADKRDLMIYEAINKANEGGIFAAWNCYQVLNRNHGVSKEEFATKVKFLEMGLWSRFKFWLARN